MAAPQFHPGVTIWVDVEDFFHYFATSPRPSGIQRFAFELMRALVAEAGPDRVRFVRHTGTDVLSEVPWAEIEAIFHGRRLGRPQNLASGQGRRQRVRRVIESLPPDLRAPLFRAGVLQLQAIRHWRERLGPQKAPAGDVNPAPVQPGDRLLVLGSAWAVPGAGSMLRQIKQRYGVIAEVLIHDLIPVRRPDWCGQEAQSVFATWLDECLPLFDRIMANSRHTAADVTAYAAERGLPLTAPARPIPVGTSFGEPQERAGDRPPGLPVPGTYVLFVATIEPRKNHELAVRVWRKLDDEVRAGLRRPESVPAMVFAGRPGWLVADLLGQLDSMHWLDGRIRLLRDPSDAELRALYEGCLFTFVPSWFEGWGLPVSESLALGKPCLASSATAIPEAGGALCRYFDPGDAGAAHRALAALLDDPAGLAAWQDQVRREFRPTAWTETARAVLANAPAELVQ